MAVEYGTIGIRPRGEWDPDTKYDLLNLVVYDGSSYVAHTAPPKGTLPTDTAYWQVSAQGIGKATADSVGTVKPDGTTTEVSAEGSLSVKQATQTTTGIVKGSEGIKVGEGGSIDVNTQFTQATELANIIAGEAIKDVLGKVSKSIATTMNLNQNALLKNMLTSIDVNDSNKVPTSAFVHTLVERIDEVNSNLTNSPIISDANNPTAVINSYNADTLNSPYKAGLTEAATVGKIISTGSGNAVGYCTQIGIPATRDYILIRRIQGPVSNSSWSEWEKLPSNSDLGAKALVLNAIPYAPGGTTYYAVKNGVCYVDTQSLNLTATGSGVIIANGLPSPAIATHTSLSAVDGSEIVGLAYVDVGTTMLRANINKIASNVWVSFSYPITS